MKTKILKLATLALLLAGIIACNKNKEEIDVDFSNIENLCEQPISVIEKAIQGKWKIVYYKGGLIANMIQYPDNHLVEFTSDKKYMDTTPIATFTTKFKWSKELRYSTSGDAVYIMRFQDAGVTPLLMKEIHNDTLVFHEYQVMDYMESYCIKIN
jgi:hypothetical protein